MLNTKDTVYEIGMHVILSKSQAEAEKLFDSVKKFLKKQDAEIISEESPKVMDLAYEIRHIERDSEGKFVRYTEAYFSSIKIRLSADKINEVDQELKENKDILRFLIIKTIDGNTRFEKPVEEVAKEENKIKVDPKKIDQIAQDAGMDVNEYIPSEEKAEKKK